MDVKGWLPIKVSRGRMFVRAAYVLTIASDTRFGVMPHHSRCSGDARFGRSRKTFFAVLSYIVVPNPKCLAACVQVFLTPSRHASVVLAMLVEPAGWSRKGRPS